LGPEIGPGKGRIPGNSQRKRLKGTNLKLKEEVAVKRTTRGREGPVEVAVANASSEKKAKRSEGV